jgi:hypothetical protein
VAGEEEDLVIFCEGSDGFWDHEVTMGCASLISLAIPWASADGFRRSLVHCVILALHGLGAGLRDYGSSSDIRLVHAKARRREGLCHHPLAA